MFANWQAFMISANVKNIVNMVEREQIKININKIDSIANGSMNGENLATQPQNSAFINVLTI